MTTQKSHTLQELLARGKAGDQEARQKIFSLLADENELRNVMIAMTRRLLTKHHPARRLVDTQDVIQSALRTGWRRFVGFRGHSDVQFYSWLRAIIRSKIHRVARRRLRPVSLECIDPAECPTREVQCTVSDIVDQEMISKLHTAVGRLPMNQRLAMELRLRGVSTREIARLLGVNPAAIRKRESRALKKLRMPLQAMRRRHFSDPSTTKSGSPSAV